MEISNEIIAGSNGVIITAELTRVEIDATRRSIENKIGQYWQVIERNNQLIIVHK